MAWVVKEHDDSEPVIFELRPKRNEKEPKGIGLSGPVGQRGLNDLWMFQRGLHNPVVTQNVMVPHEE